jgi:flavin reductase (DIM6/NTAB) family NADH-FMN oxidoreductase RutF/rubredoxin
MIDFNTLKKLTYGLYIVASEYKGVKSGYIGNTVFQVSSTPPVIAISCNKKNATCNSIINSGTFSVSILQHDADLSIIKDFGYNSSTEIDKFSKWSFLTGKLGVPVVNSYCIAGLECRVSKEIDCGSHILFLGEILHAEKFNDNPPITYEQYHELYKLSSPENAPTYISPELLAEDRKDLITPNNAPSEHICIICGYTYDPEEGDPANDIPPGTAFEDLPEDYICPVCRAGKSYFREV